MTQGVPQILVRGNPSDDEVIAITSAYLSYISTCQVGLFEPERLFSSILGHIDTGADLSRNKSLTWRQKHKIYGYYA